MSDATDTRTFAERIRDANAEQMAAIHRRNAIVGEILTGNHPRARVGEIVAIEDFTDEHAGAFVAEVTRDGKTTWQAVNHGRRLVAAFYTRPAAILYLLSVRYGDGDDMGTAAGLAGRVIGIKDEPADE